MQNKTFLLSESVSEVMFFLKYNLIPTFCKKLERNWMKISCTIIFSGWCHPNVTLILNLVITEFGSPLLVTLKYSLQRIKKKLTYSPQSIGPSFWELKKNMIYRNISNRLTEQTEQVVPLISQAKGMLIHNGLTEEL